MGVATLTPAPQSAIIHRFGKAPRRGCNRPRHGIKGVTLTQGDSTTKLCECGCGQPAPIAERTRTWAGHIKGQPVRFISGHNGRQDAESRLWSKVDKNGPVSNYAPHLGRCWVWTGVISTPGYGRLAISTNGTKKQVQAHRYVYERLRGAIPEGLELDHLCRVRRCVNPDHLEPVPHGENLRRSPLVQAHCEYMRPLALDARRRKAGH